MGRARTSQQLRIIGGQWRGRKLRFPAIAGLRPTPDRVRETLFNWLAPSIYGARCLDLFAGSGALGIEALSRGASSVVFVEHDPQATKLLRENLRLLQTDAAELINRDALGWLKQATPVSASIVFLDPPFGRNYLESVCGMLENSGHLTTACLIYLESDIKTSVTLPVSWEVLRDKTAGQVRYRLARRAVSVEKIGG